MIIISHHKSGYVYSRKVFTDFCKSVNINLVNYSHKKKINSKKLLNKNEKFFFRIKDSSKKSVQNLLNFYSEHNLVKPNIFHFIRDPRSLIISATLYHRKEDRDIEKWRFKGLKKFDGKSYFDIISQLSIEDAILFEMFNLSYDVIKSMIRINNNFNTINIKLEEVSNDSSCQVYEKIFAESDIDSTLKNEFIEAFKKHSIWYRKKTSENNWLTGNSTLSVSEEWKKYFESDVIKKTYLRTFRNAHQKLGYQ